MRVEVSASFHMVRHRDPHVPLPAQPGRRREIARTIPTLKGSGAGDRSANSTVTVAGLPRLDHALSVAEP